MRNLFSRKTMTPLDVLAPTGPDEAYASLPADLVRHAPILAALVAEWRTRGELPVGVVA